MFEKFLNKLKKSALADEARHLHDACAAMDIADPGLAGEVTDYILTGKPESCIARISNLEEVFGGYSPGKSIMLQPREKYLGQNEKIFQSMPLLLSSTTIQDPNILHRLSLVFNACAGDHKFHDKQTEINGWFGNMLNLFDEYSERCKDDSRYRIQCPDRATLLDLASQFEVSEDFVDAYILEGYLGIYRNTGVFISYLRQTTDWIELLRSPEYQKKVLLMKPSAREALCYQLKDTKGVLPPYIIPVVTSLLTDKSKVVCKVAATFISKVPMNDLTEYLEKNYQTGKSDVRNRWVSFIADIPSGERLLQQWLKTESVPSVVDAIQNKLALLESKKESDLVRSGPVPEYKPNTRPRPNWKQRIRQSLDKMISEERINISQLSEKVSRLSQALSNSPLDDGSINHKSERQTYEITRREWERSEEELSKYININDKDIERYLIYIEKGGSIFKDRSIAKAAQRAGVFDDDSISFLQYIRQIWCLGYGEAKFYGDEKFDRLLEKEIIDFRQLVLIYRQHHQDESKIINRITCRGYIVSKLPISHEKVSVWPFFAENPEYIDNGFKGVSDKKGYYEESDIISRTLFLVGLFPSIPRSWEIQLYQYAIGSNKEYRTLAQDSAEKLGLIIHNVTSSLSSKNKDERTNAAKWLGKIKNKSAISYLNTAIKKEKDLSVKAVFLDSLEMIGESISDFITKKQLLSEAELGLKKSIPASLKSFPQDTLPELYFNDQEKVPSELIYWWIILAVKLQDPESNSLLKRYNQLLDEASQFRLGGFLFSTFISLDTRTASDEECHQYALENQSEQLENYNDLANRGYDKYQGITLEQTYNILYRRKKSTLIGSAIKNKGMLGLISKLNGHDAIALLKAYMKKHYIRRAQIEVMLLVVSRFDDDVIVQFLLATAQRYRTRSIQETAQSLVEAISERRGWSRQDLIDLTIPCAGLEKANKATVFDYGQRHLTLSLTKDMKLQLGNEKQEVIKALPQPRLDDDQTELKEIKKWFNACKRELKQTIEQQTIRFPEAMITDQHWLVTQWHERLYQHPIMHRLLQRMLWQIEQGDDWISVRINSDAELISLSGGAVQYEETSRIRVLSANNLSNAECADWVKYLKKNKIKPLFEQLKKADIKFTSEQKNLTEYHGFLTGSYTLVNTMNALGYKRGSVDDDKCRSFEFYKDFNSLGFTAVLECTGLWSPLFEHDVAILNIYFVYQKNQKPYPHGSNIAYLRDVPENLLHAIVLDYQAIGQLCQYDENWRDNVL